MVDLVVNKGGVSYQDLPIFFRIFENFSPAAGCFALRNHTFGVKTTKKIRLRRCFALRNHTLGVKTPNFFRLRRAVLPLEIVFVSLQMIFMATAGEIFEK